MNNDLNIQIELIDYTIKKKREHIANLVIDIDELEDLREDLKRRLNKKKGILYMGEKKGRPKTKFANTRANQKSIKERETKRSGRTVKVGPNKDKY